MIIPSSPVLVGGAGNGPIVNFTIGYASDNSTYHAVGYYPDWIGSFSAQPIPGCTIEWFYEEYEYISYELYSWLYRITAPSLDTLSKYKTLTIGSQTRNVTFSFSGSGNLYLMNFDFDFYLINQAGGTFPMQFKV
jgi:hypothetical protein